MTAIRKFDNISEATVDDEVVVMRLDTGEFYSLTGTGAAIWRLIDGSRDRAKVLCDLAEMYQADEVEMAADVDAYLQQLRDDGILADT